ncbi:hypothetical protein [Streptomyces niveus]|uniref:hypothetical protein n=1 Tax=Streptomyces niveus TaxID=193462 RepID=UPI0036849D6D
MSIESQAKTQAETYEPKATSDAGSAGIGEPSGPKAYVIDVGTIRDTVSAAREVPVSRDARSRISSTTEVLVGMLELLLGEDLNFELDAAVRGMYRTAYRLLRIGRRPTNDDPTVVAWQYMRDVAEMTSQLVAAYADQQGGAEFHGR